MELTLIKMALAVACQTLPTASVNAYADIIHAQSVKLNQDPLITVAIIKHESKCNSSVISDDKFDWGLMQIRAMYYKGPAVNLLNPWINITVGSYWIQSSYEFCEKQLGREPVTQEWLSCFQGTCKHHGKWCQPTKMTNRVEEYATCLQHNVISNMSVENCDAIYAQRL
jgi:hypothetical protein